MVPASSLCFVTFCRISLLHHRLVRNGLRNLIEHLVDGVILGYVLGRFRRIELVLS